MPRRRKSNKPQEPRPNDDWVQSEEYEANGRKIQRDTELSIEGESGRYRFRRHVRNPKNGAEWIDVVGGPQGVHLLPLISSRPNQAGPLEEQNRRESCCRTEECRF